MLPGAAELVDRLSRCFRLGLIANQGSECRARLAALGLLDPFEVIAFSEERGLSKPDPAPVPVGARPGGASPPRNAGWSATGSTTTSPPRPTWAWRPPGSAGRDRAAKGWRPRDPEAVAYRDSLERSARLLDPKATRMQPTVCVDQVRHLGPALVLS